MAPDEREHRRTMSRLERSEDAEASEAILNLESWHRSAGSGTLRANIFEASDAGVKVVEMNLDECTLCDLCIQAAPDGKIRVVKLYDQE